MAAVPLPRPTGPPDDSRSPRADRIAVRGQLPTVSWMVRTWLAGLVALSLRVRGESNVTDGQPPRLSAHGRRRDGGPGRRRSGADGTRSRPARATRTRHQATARPQLL